MILVLLLVVMMTMVMMTIKTDINLVVFKHTQGGYEQRRAGLQMPPFPGFYKMFTPQSTLGRRHYGSPPGEA